jgi:hypothetical protein
MHIIHRALHAHRHRRELRTWNATVAALRPGDTITVVEATTGLTLWTAGPAICWPYAPPIDADPLTARLWPLTRAGRLMVGDVGLEPHTTATWATTALAITRGRHLPCDHTTRDITTEGLQHLASARRHPVITITWTDHHRLGPGVTRAARGRLIDADPHAITVGGRDPIEIDVDAVTAATITTPDPTPDPAAVQWHTRQVTP